VVRVHQGDRHRTHHVAPRLLAATILLGATLAAAAGPTLAATTPATTRPARIANATSPAPASSLFLEGEPGSGLAEAVPVALSTVTLHTSGSRLTFTAAGTDQDGPTTYEVDLAPAAPATQLATGNHPNAQAEGYNPVAGHPYLSVSETGIGCVDSTGQFIVDQISYDTGGNLTSLAARFRWQCQDSGGAPPVFGNVAYQSTTAYPQPQLSYKLLRPSTRVGGNSGAYAEVVHNTGTGSDPISSATLTGADAASYALTRDSCSGTTLAAGASCTLAIEFTPTAVTAQTDAALVLVDRLAPANFGGYQIPLQGSSFVDRPDGEYTPLSPARVLDTRIGTGSGHPGAIAAGSQVDLTITGQGGIPTTGVSAVVLNVTVTQPDGPGYLTVFPTASGPPATSNVNFVTGQTIANQVTVPVDASGRVSFRAGVSATQVVADVAGFYADPSGPNGLRYYALFAGRVLDTRIGLGAPTGPVAANHTLALALDTSSMLPDTQEAVVLNVTVTQPDASGYLTVYPDAPTRPLASSINFSSGQTIANQVIVPMPASGVIDLYNYVGDTQVVADVLGYYREPANNDYGRFVAVAPTRMVDTRLTNTPVGPGDSLRVFDSLTDLTYRSALVTNLTVTSPTAAGYLTIWLPTSPIPATSNLDFVPGGTSANAAIAPEDHYTSGFLVFNSAGTSQVVIDVFGYFLGDPGG
jgi:hypothetical protein